MPYSPAFVCCHLHVAGVFFCISAYHLYVVQQDGTLPISQPYSHGFAFSPSTRHSTDRAVRIQRDFAFHYYLPCLACNPCRYILMASWQFGDTVACTCLGPFVWNLRTHAATFRTFLHTDLFFSRSMTNACVADDNCAFFFCMSIDIIPRHYYSMVAYARRLRDAYLSVNGWFGLYHVLFGSLWLFCVRCFPTHTHCTSPTTTLWFCARAFLRAPVYNTYLRVFCFALLTFPSLYLVRSVQLQFLSIMLISSIC